MLTSVFVHLFFSSPFTPQTSATSAGTGHSARLGSQGWQARTAPALRLAGACALPSCPAPRPVGEVQAGAGRRDARSWSKGVMLRGFPGPVHALPPQGHSQGLREALHPGHPQQHIRLWLKGDPGDTDGPVLSGPRRVLVPGRDRASSPQASPVLLRPPTGLVLAWNQETRGAGSGAGGRRPLPPRMAAAGSDLFLL